MTTDLVFDAAFDAAIAIVLRHEGGYVDDPHDPGGETKFGISKRQYPDLEIAALTEEQARAIYYDDFWQRYRICALPGTALPGKVLDTAVLAGPRTAIRLLQKALNAGGCALEVDGSIGPATAEACSTADAQALLVRYRALLVEHYREIVASHPDEARFLHGWEARANS